MMFDGARAEVKALRYFAVRKMARQQQCDLSFAAGKSIVPNARRRRQLSCGRAFNRPYETSRIRCILNGLGMRILAWGRPYETFRIPNTVVRRVQKSYPLVAGYHGGFWESRLTRASLGRL